MLGNVKYALEVARALIIKEDLASGSERQRRREKWLAVPFMDMPWHFNAFSRRL